MNARNRLRTLIAQETARIIVEDGVDDLLAAKQKAARHLGIEGESHAPNNDEIEEALAEYHRIYRISKQGSHLGRLRKIALESMKFLASFSPRLAGSVANGTAGKFTPITLYLFAETAEEIFIDLLNAKIPFRQVTHEYRNSKKEKTAYPAFNLLINGIRMELKYLPIGYLHQLPKNKKARYLSIDGLIDVIEQNAEQPHGQAGITQSHSTR